MKLASLVRVATVAAAFVISGCQTLSENRGALIGAGAGAVAGTVLGDGGIILPAIGAVGGAVIGEEIAERDPLFD